jgi:hypothetical protein
LPFFQEHSNVESMEWYTTLATYSMPENEDESDENISDLEKDPDRKLLTLVVEKVLLVKMTGLVSAAYDPLSTSQTLKLTGTLNRLNHFPIAQL